MIIETIVYEGYGSCVAYQPGGLVRCWLRTGGVLAAGSPRGGPDRPGGRPAAQRRAVRVPGPTPSGADTPRDCPAEIEGLNHSPAGAIPYRARVPDCTTE
jgi:hypothetical protein